jgi:hypothetical protein
MKYVLESTGNIPVERKSSDRRVLFKGTFEALAQGWAVALFPEVRRSRSYAPQSGPLLLTRDLSYFLIGHLVHRATDYAGQRRCGVVRARVHEVGTREPRQSSQEASNHRPGRDRVHEQEQVSV